MLGRLPAMHVADIVGNFALDPYGRPVLRMHVWVHDSGHAGLGNVAVEASVTWPGGGPVQRMRYTRPSGWARFHWGANAPGTWRLCVDTLTKEGYVYQPDQNDVPACREWQN